MNDQSDILVSLAKNGEIDPWDIDIVDVTDKFLAQVAELEKLDLPGVEPNAPFARYC